MLLYPDGRWRYAPAPTPAAGAKVHARAPAATEKVDLLRGGMSLFIDPGKWKQTSSEDPTKISFRHVKVTFEEQRRVNDVDVLAMQMEGTIQGIPFTYYGYYFSGPQGSVQLLTYTGSNLFAEYKPEFEDFLNGLTPSAQR